MSDETIHTAFEVIKWVCLMLTAVSILLLIIGAVSRLRDKRKK